MSPNILAPDSTLRIRRICYVATVDFAFKWYLASHLKLQKEMYSLTLISNGGREGVGPVIDDRVKFYSIPIHRHISLYSDISNLFWLIKFFKAEKFDCVHSIMMKSGLLAMIAAKFAGVPMRLHTFTGQRWVTKKGLFRFFLKLMDRLLALNATHLFADSNSQKDFIVQNKITTHSKISVLGDGSIMGFDINRFKPNKEMRKKIRYEYKISEDEVVFIFVGRLSVDKGLLDLKEAFYRLSESLNGVHLMIVGPDEGVLKREFEELEEKLIGRVHVIGPSEIPEYFMAAADILCLPSYREGFGNVIIEAALVGIPTIASRIYGITDAVVEGVTGILHEPGSILELKDAMLSMSQDGEIRSLMGIKARLRALQMYPHDRLANLLVEFYERQPYFHS